MQSFGKGNIKKIKELVYNSWAHDALLESFTYNGNGETAKIEFFNPIYKIKTTMIFSDIEVVLMTKGDWGGERETIISLSAEDDFSYLQAYLPKCNAYSEDSIYLLFQTASGDELHIAAKEVMIDVVK